MTRLVLTTCLVLAMAQATPPRFQSGVEVVRVNVLVMDGNRPVAGLTAADFELRDSTVVQQVESATLTDIPVSMLLVLDTSQSVQGQHARAAQRGGIRRARSARRPGPGVVAHVPLVRRPPGRLGAAVAGHPVGASTGGGWWRHGAV